MVNLWLDNAEEKLQKIPYIDPQEIRSEINEKYFNCKNPICRIFTTISNHHSIFDQSLIY